MLRNENLKREIESLLIAAENNGISTNYINAKIGNTQKNNKCRLFVDLDQTYNKRIL